MRRRSAVQRDPLRCSPPSRRNMRKLLAVLAIAAVAAGCSSDKVTDAGSVFGLELAVTPPLDTLVASTQVQLVATRSEEHTSELQSQFHLVCRLLLEKKKTQH